MSNKCCTSSSVLSECGLLMKDCTDVKNKIKLNLTNNNGEQLHSKTSYQKGGVT